MSISATPVMDETGDDLTFSFLAFHSFINGLVLYLHDNNVLSDIYIGLHGPISVTLSVPDNVSPIEGASSVVVPLGVAYLLRFEPVQVFGSVQNIALYYAIQPNVPIAGSPIVV